MRNRRRKFESLLKWLIRMSHTLMILLIALWLLLHASQALFF